MIMVYERIDTIGGYVTICKAAELKQTKADTLYKWLRRNNIPTKRIGRSLIVELSRLEAYTPRGTRN